MLNDAEVDSFQGASKDDLLSLLRLIDVDADGFHRDAPGKIPAPAAASAISYVSSPMPSLASALEEAVIDEHELVLKQPPMLRGGGAARPQQHSSTRIAVTSVVNAKAAKTLERALPPANDENMPFNKTSAIRGLGPRPSAGDTVGGVHDNSNQRIMSFRDLAALDM